MKMIYIIKKIKIHGDDSVTKKINGVLHRKCRKCKERQEYWEFYLTKTKNGYFHINPTCKSCRYNANDLYLRKFKYIENDLKMFLCKKCGEYKLRIDFYEDKKQRDNITCYCKACIRLITKDQYRRKKKV